MLNMDVYDPIFGTLACIVILVCGFAPLVLR